VLYLNPLGKRHFLASSSFWKPQVILPISAPVFSHSPHPLLLGLPVSTFSSSYKDNSQEMKADLNPLRPSLDLVISAKIIFLSKVTQILKGRTAMKLWGKHK
jgi:hypothetical protein